MSDYHLATKSLQEEKKAVKDYTQRISDGKNSNLRRALTHALNEEKTHVKMFSAVKQELSHEQKMVIIKKAASMGKK